MRYCNITYWRVRFGLLTIWLFAIAQDANTSPNRSPVDSLISKISYTNQNDTQFTDVCLTIARYYDDNNQFDSMQHWLNVGKDKLTVLDTQIAHFNYSAFQSIAYYYNGLLQMDLYESYKVLEIAQALNDSILLTTGYNFVGLANSNVGEYQKAIPFFYKGMNYARQPPFDLKYKVTSKPHHLYGNLAEAYYKLKKYDSALFNVQRSLKLAIEINSKRGIAVAHNLIGLIYHERNQLDSALFYQNKALQDGTLFNELDISLIACAAISKIMLARNDFQKSKEYLSKGFKLIQQNPNINYYFTKQFLEVAYQNYSQMKDQRGVLYTLESISKNNAKINGMTDQQVKKIIENGIKHESRANKLALTKVEQQRNLSIIIFITTLIALITTGLFFLFNYQNNKKRLKEISLRQEISRDLHDDIGSTLSSIKLYNELSLLEQEKNTMHAIPITQKISILTSDLMSRVSDVIYVLKNDQLDDKVIITRVKTIVHDLLIPKDIEPLLSLDQATLRKIENPVYLKNIFLIIKEAVNNVAKYSQAKICKVRIFEKDKQLFLEIEDNGIGMNQEKQTGNGISNMKFRSEQMGGFFFINANEPNGTIVRCILPLSSLRYLNNEKAL